MRHDNLFFAIIGFSASLLLCLPGLKKWQRRHLILEKFRIINQVLQQAEERASRLQERHDRLLTQTCSYYLINKELEEALEGARATMNEAMEFATELRRIQMKVICSFPEDVDLSMLHRDSSQGHITN